MKVCREGQHLTAEDTCSECSDNCKACTANETCVHCDPNFVLAENGTCVETCEAGSFSRSSFAIGSECVACRDACDGGEYETQPCAATSDRVCTACSECASGTFKTGGCQSSYDANCTTWSGECPVGEFEIRAPTAMVDRVCNNCTTSTPSDHFRAENCSGSVDTVYKRCSECKSTEYAEVACSDSADVQCNTCGDGEWDSCITMQLGECSNGSG